MHLYCQQATSILFLHSQFWTMPYIAHLAHLREKLISDEQFMAAVKNAAHQNPWFTENFVRESIQAISEYMLNESALRQWLNNYQIRNVNKTIGLIFAGNVPLVGFHDFLCCYVTGCNMKIKLSSKDEKLFPEVLRLLSSIDESLHERVELVEKLEHFDAVIATGSDNTHRYFEYYFRNHPNILRKNRNSVAVLSGDETDAELKNLAHDVFLYFGFGCRNVSKIYVPVGFDITRLFPLFESYSWLHHHTKYMNNYDYQRTLLLMNKTPHLANEFVMILENESISSPIATLHYETWHDKNVLLTKLKNERDKIQCIVSSNPSEFNFSSSVAFGEAQHPGLADYADGKDTLSFLLSL